MPIHQTVVVEIQSAASRGMGSQIDDDTADNSVPADPNNNGGADGRIIACGIFSGGANESDCTNNNGGSDGRITARCNISRGANGQIITCGNSNSGGANESACSNNNSGECHCWCGCVGFYYTGLLHQTKSELLQNRASNYQPLSHPATCQLIKLL